MAAFNDVRGVFRAKKNQKYCANNFKKNLHNIKLSLSLSLWNPSPAKPPSLYDQTPAQYRGEPGPLVLIHLLQQPETNDGEA